MNKIKECPSEEEIIDVIYCEEEGLEQGELSTHINQCNDCKHIYDNLKDIDDGLQQLKSFTPTKNITSSLKKGDKLGSYEIISLIGQGGMGKVYKAYDPNLDRDVAIKIIKDDLSHNDIFKKRFIIEAKTVAHLKHPNIVQIYQCNVEEHHTYLIMEYIDGIVLSSYPFVRSGNFPTHLNLFKQAILGLKCAHNSGVIHRDIKTSNIMICRQGTAHLLDFGIAKSEMHDQQFTMTGDLLGTVAYMAPEIAIGGKASVLSDIYAMGIVLFEIITGKVPYKSDTPLSTLNLINTMPLPDPREIVAGVPEDICRFIAKMCHKIPAERYANCDEVLVELDKIISAYSNDNKINMNLEASTISSRISQSDNSTLVGPGDNTINSIANDMGISPRRAKSALNRDKDKRDRDIEKSLKPKSRILLWVIAFVILFSFIFLGFLFLLMPTPEPGQVYIQKDINKNLLTKSTIFTENKFETKLGAHTYYDGLSAFRSNSSSLKVLGAQTWCCEFKANTNIESQFLLSNIDKRTGRNGGLVIRVVSGFYWAQTGNGSAHQNLITSIRPSETSYDKIVLVYKPSEMSLYINDKLVGNIFAGHVKSRVDFVIGSCVSGSELSLKANGSLKNIEIYSGEATNPLNWVPGSTHSLLKASLLLQCKEGSSNNEQRINFTKIGNPVTYDSK